MDNIEKTFRDCFDNEYNFRESIDLSSDEEIKETIEWYAQQLVKNHVALGLVIETSPIGKDYIILYEPTYRDRQGMEKTACYEWIDGKKIYYTHKDNIYSYSR